MRVTQQLMYDNLLKGIRQQTDNRATAQANVSSGTRFQRPAQAGLDYKISLDIRHTQVQIQRGVDGISTARSRLDVSQALLNDMAQIMTRAQVIAVQQGTASVGAAERQNAAVEVAHLRDAMTQLANKRWEGQAVFSGIATDQDAFDASGAYIGSNQDRIVAISATESVVSNVRGDDTAFIDSFASLQALEDALTNNDQTAVITALGSLNLAGNSMVNLTSKVGSQISSLDVREQAFQDMKFTLEKRLNDHEGVDIPAMVVQLQQAENALQASYSQVSNMKQLSLLNFLR
ncbi:MAG: hypothetical protein R8M38_07420 [Mariprofundaceae bacterium]